MRNSDRISKSSSGGPRSRFKTGDSRKTSGKPFEKESRRTSESRRFSEPRKTSESGGFSEPRRTSEQRMFSEQRRSSDQRGFSERRGSAEQGGTSEEGRTSPKRNVPGAFGRGRSGQAVQGKKRKTSSRTASENNVFDNATGVGFRKRRPGSSSTRSSGTAGAGKNGGRRRSPPISKVRASAGSVFGMSNSQSERDFDSSKGHRLQQVLAAAGFGSRRQCEELIVTGRVDVDRETVTELGVRVFPQEQEIRIDGELLPRSRPVYVVLNKPRGVLCTNYDQQGRTRTIDLIPPELGRLFPVGRLDQNSEGLILMTNDGALADRLTHPRYEVPKTYLVQVAGLVDPSLVQALKQGVYIAEGVVQADDVSVKLRHKLSSVLEIVLKEGKNREIRRMLARLGHKVMSLQRTAVGPIKLGKMLPGEFRRLTSEEVRKLYQLAQLNLQKNKGV